MPTSFGPRPLRCAVVLVALGLGPGAAAPSPAHQMPAGRERLAGVSAEADAALARWDIAGARRALAAQPAAPGPMGVLQRLQVEFHDGRYDEALRLLGELPPEVAERMQGFRRLAEATRDMQRRLRPRESEHFVLWLDEERDWVLAEPALEALEAGWSALGGWLGEHPAAKVRVEIVPSAEDFERVSSLTRREIEGSGAVAICKFNKLMLLSPRLLVRGYPWRDTLNHEYLHYLLVRASADRAPIWLQEGVARYGESLWRSAESLYLEEADRAILARGLRESALIDFEAMEVSLVRLPTMGHVRLAFAECAFAVDHLVRTWGAGGLRRLLVAFAAGEEERGWDGALRTALGVSAAAFDEAWRADLRARGFVEIPGLIVPEMRLATPGERDAEEWDLEEWQPEAARNHLVLGDMLRARGHGRAAVLEYEKARRVAPASPFVHLKISRAKFGLGRAREAAAAAREALRFSPGYPAANEALGAALAALGDLEGARAALAESLEVNPYNPYAWRDLGGLLRRGGRAAAAQRAFATALRLAPHDPELRRSVSEENLHPVEAR